MDLSVITRDWPYDEYNEANNVRKIVGLDGETKLQVRLRNGLTQWAIEARPDGQTAYGFPTMLAYCRHVIEERVADGEEDVYLEPRMVDELGEELFDYCRRCRALFLFGDYRRALDDVSHGLAIVGFLRNYTRDPAVSFSYDQYRTSLLANRAQTEMLRHVRADEPRDALDALNRGIAEIESYYYEYEMNDEIEDCGERQLLIDLRRSLREKHNVPLSSEELLKSLQTEQEIAIRKENYEMAARLRDKISKLQQRSGTSS